MLSQPDYVYRLPQIGDLGKFEKSTLHTGISIVQTASDGRMMIFFTAIFSEFESDRDVFEEFGNTSPRLEKGNIQNCCHIRHHINYLFIALTYYRTIIQTVLHRSRVKSRFIQLSSSKPKLRKS